MGSGMTADLHALSEVRLPDRFRLRSAEIDLNANAISVRGETHRITPKAAGVLRLLAERSGRAVTRDELLQSVWVDAFPRWATA